VFSSLFLNACNFNNESSLQPISNSTFGVGNIANVTPKYDFYTVRYHDTLQKIATKFNVSKDDLIKSNSLGIPYKLRVGQRLKVPVPLAAQLRVSPLARHSLLWPTNGRITHTFATASTGSKGIEIAGALGQEIKASAAGKVVYSGSSLTGYGRVVIIKHSDNVVTVYALNKLVLVKEGQVVKAGEQIAVMGNNTYGDVVLHFEVRIDGKPYNPLLYLEKRGIN